jgi:hypothetical protein
MSDRIAEVEAALDRLVAAARAHLAAVSAAAGAPDDDGVWRAYVTLNNAAYDYDRVLGAAFDEVTPFDVERIVDDADGATFTSTLVSFPPAAGDDPHPRVVSVRQRRDYRVPSVAALLRVAQEGRPATSAPAAAPVATVGAAIIELLESGDGSLGMLDLPELEPLDGVVVVAEVDVPLRPDMIEADSTTAEAPFRLGPGETVVARLHETAPTDGE